MSTNKLHIVCIIPYLVILSLFICLHSCSDSLDKTPFQPENIGTDIKDTTEAGSRIKIIGGTIGTTTASIGFRFEHMPDDDYNVWIERGTTDSTYEFKEILNKYPNDFIGDVNNVYHFTNLKSQTIYYILFTSEKNAADIGKLGIKITTL